MLMALPHRLGHTLGLLITREMDTIQISHTRILPDPLSDHQAVRCFINLPRPVPITVSHRKTWDIDLDAFGKDICRVFFKELVDGRLGRQDNLV